MTNTLIRYVRVPRGKNRGAKCGVVLATKTPENKIQIGWSFTALAKGDVFDKTLGINIALNRAAVGTKSKTPHAVRELIPGMEDRARRYFKVPVKRKRSVVKRVLEALGVVEPTPAAN